MSACGVPDAWMRIADRAARPGGTVVLIGGSDAGKTTLAVWLAGRLAERGLRVAAVDADVGQSRLGPPATVGWAWGAEGRPAGLRFAGDVTPAGMESRCLAAVGACAEEARQAGAEVVLCDTTGWVSGAGALEYKLAKTDLLRGSLGVLVEREGELQPYRRALRGRVAVEVLSVAAVAAVRPRSVEDRRARRREAFAAHLREPVEVELDLRTVGLTGLSWLRERSLLGLADGSGRLLALGLAGALDRHAGTLMCTAQAAGAGAAQVVVGRIALDAEFGELRCTETEP